MHRRSNHWKRMGRRDTRAWSDDELATLKEMRACNLDTANYFQVLPTRTTVACLLKLKELGLGRPEPIRS